MSSRSAIGFGVAAGLGIAAIVGAGSVTPGPQTATVGPGLTKIGTVIDLKACPPGLPLIPNPDDAGFYCGYRHISTDAGIETNGLTVGKICLTSNCDHYIEKSGPNLNVVAGSTYWDFGSSKWTFGGAGPVCAFGCEPPTYIKIQQDTNNFCYLKFGTNGQLRSHNCPIATTGDAGLGF